MSTEETADIHEALVNLAMSFYLGEKCKYCLKEFTTMDDLKDAVWAGYHEHGRLAHERCWKENNPEETK